MVKSIAATVSFFQGGGPGGGGGVSRTKGRCKVYRNGEPQGRSGDKNSLGYSYGSFRGSRPGVNTGFGYRTLVGLVLVLKGE